MNIEKKKVTENTHFSKVTKAGLASLLGMTSVFMSACISDTESGVPMVPADPDSSDSSKGSENPSSSSVADIPLSHEHISSAAEDALSSATLSSSSSEIIYEAGVIPPYEDLPINVSSSSEEISSSAENPPASSQTESSSSINAPSSSSDAHIIDNPCEFTDSTGVKVIMCRDNDHGMMASMVSTYDMFDMS